MYSKFHSLINDFWLTPLLANESEKKRPTKTFLFSSPIGKQQTDKFKNDIVNRDDDHVDNIPIQRIKITPLKCPSPSAYSTVESLEPPPPSIQKIHSKKVHKYTLRYALDLEKKRSRSQYRPDHFWRGDNCVNDDNWPAIPTLLRSIEEPVCRGSQSSAAEGIHPDQRERHNCADCCPLPIIRLTRAARVPHNKNPRVGRERLLSNVVALYVIIIHGRSIQKEALTNEPKKATINKHNRRRWRQGNQRLKIGDVSCTILKFFCRDWAHSGWRVLVQIQNMCLTWSYITFLLFIFHQYC